jgi:hypothetical protein
MSQLQKTKRQANLKDFKRFGAFKGLVEQKNVVFNSFLCNLGFFLALVYFQNSRFTRVLNWSTHAKKSQNYTRTR